MPTESINIFDQAKAPQVLVDSQGRVIRSPEVEAEIAELKARITQLEALVRRCGCRQLLEPDQTICHACGAAWQKGSP
jgi:hypothetical protein